MQLVANPRSGSSAWFEQIRRTPVQGEFYVLYSKKNDVTGRTSLGLDVIGRDIPISLNTTGGEEDLAKYCGRSKLVLLSEPEKWQTLKEPRRDPQTKYTESPIERESIDRVRERYMALIR
jgi:hypothetical protein